MCCRRPKNEQIPFNSLASSQIEHANYYQHPPIESHKNKEEHFFQVNRHVDGGASLHTSHGNHLNSSQDPCRSDVCWELHKGVANKNPTVKG